MKALTKEIAEKIQSDAINNLNNDGHLKSKPKAKILDQYFKKQCEINKISFSEYKSFWKRVNEAQF